LRGFYDENTDSIRWVKEICPDCHGTGEEAGDDDKAERGIRLLG
jgi:hypothetical protein